MRDLKNNLKIDRSISPVSVSDNTAQVGQVIDHQGFDSALYEIFVGSFGDAAATLVPLLEESNDGDNFTAVDDAHLEGSEAAASFTQAEDNTIKTLGYKGIKRYTRLTLTPADNGTALLLSASCIKGHASNKPVA